MNAKASCSSRAGGSPLQSSRLLCVRIRELTADSLTADLTDTKAKQERSSPQCVNHALHFAKRSMHAHWHAGCWLLRSLLSCWSQGWREQRRGCCGGNRSGFECCVNPWQRTKLRTIAWNGLLQGICALGFPVPSRSFSLLLGYFSSDSFCDMQSLAGGGHSCLSGEFRFLCCPLTVKYGYVARGPEAPLFDAVAGEHGGCV